MKHTPRAAGKRRLLASVCAFLLIVPPIQAASEDLVLVFAEPAPAPAAGGPLILWLNVLNPSGRDQAWTFPEKIEARISQAGTSSGCTLERREPSEPGRVIIPAGAFARREYVVRAGAPIRGQVVMAFPELKASSLALALSAPPAEASAPAAEETRFNRLVKKVEPKEPGTPFDAGHFFKEHISAYEPFYFIAGAKSPNAKFQISFQYQLLSDDGQLATRVPALRGIHIAYTQTSLWDWNAPSAPFYDTSYKPSLFYVWEDALGGRDGDWYRLDLQGGAQHESNGKDGPSSRSYNIAYFRPTLVLGYPEEFQVTLQPRAWVYLGDLSDNPDIADYRGHVDLRLIAGWSRGIQLSMLGRLGDRGSHASGQFDLTYPLMRMAGSFSLYLQAQYFTGYGESLLGYKQRSDIFRAGFALYR